MRDLVTDMVKEIPSERPTMDEVVARFDRIQASLSSWTLRRPIKKRKWPLLLRAIMKIPGVFRAVQYAMSGTPAVPVPSDDRAWTVLSSSFLLFV